MTAPLPPTPMMMCPGGCGGTEYLLAQGGRIICADEDCHADTGMHWRPGAAPDDWPDS